MTDLRQGVSASTHEVLDLLEASAKGWEDQHTLGAQLNEARLAVRDAHGGFITEQPLAEIRTRMVEAAARLLDALHEIDRCIAAGET